MRGENSVRIFSLIIIMLLPAVLSAASDEVRRLRKSRAKG